MANKSLWRRLATTLQSYPWVIALPYRVWRRFQTHYTVGVVGVIFNGQQQVLLAEHVFHPRTPWGLPGGWVQRRESSALAVGREIAEELQLEVQVGLLLLAEFRFGNHLDLAYLCFPQNEVGKLSYELLNYQWYNIHQLPVLQEFHYRAIMRAVELKQGVYETL